MRSGDSHARDSDRMIGASFGQYRIVELLGAGGMGEVWRARDTRLDRDVALKMLPEELAADPDRMARFTREARALASLNHPNVAVLYGLEHLPLTERQTPPQGSSDEGATAGHDDRDPVHLLVMELVDGESLEEIVSRGPMTFDEAVRVALQIADGLHAAHERGIVHRDLKPANIKVRPDGGVKVLDFGLALVVAGRAPEDGDSVYPTTSHHRTALGAVIGTAAYMSPEQARGRQVDRRADIWAFGCLLFEMLTGTKAFGGPTLSDTVAAVLKEEPDWSALPRGFEPVARHVLRRCLAKDADRRFHDIVDVRIELEEARAVAMPAARARRVGRVRWAVRAAVAVATVAVAFAAAAALLRPTAPPLPSFRDLSFQSGRVASARFTPDGATVVYGLSTRDRPQGLMSTRTDSVESRALDLPPADVLGISRNGRMAVLLDRHCEGTWVSVGTLAVADLAGGAPREIMDRVNDGDISADGQELAVAREHGSRQRLEFPIGRVLFETDGWISHLRIAPDGQRVAFLHHPYYGDDRGLVAMLDRSGVLTELTDELSDSLQGLAWSPDGRSVWFSAFVFGKGGVLFEVRPGEPVVERLRAPISVRLQDIAGDGRILLTAGDTRAEIAGRLAGHDDERRYVGWNDDSVGGVAADGSWFAGNIQVSTVDGEYAAFARRADGSPPVRLGWGDVIGVSPDGAWVFARHLAGDRDKIIMLPTGPGEPRVIDLEGLELSGATSATVSCSLDGRLAAFLARTGEGDERIHVLELESGSVRAVGPGGTSAAVLSPDGARVAAVDPDGRITVYPVDGGPSVEVPGILDRELPLSWSLDGKALLLWNRSFPARVFRVSIANGARELALEIMPDNPAGVLYGQIYVAPGGSSYVYRYRRDFSTLFLVDGFQEAVVGRR